MTRPCLTASLLCATVVLLPPAVPIVRAHLTSQDANAIPFSFRPAPPGFRLSSEYGRWLALVEQHEPGADDAAAQSLLKAWSSPRIAEAVGSMEHDGRASVVQIKRAVLLHTDVATWSMIGAELPDTASLAWTAALHFGVAFELANFLARRDPAEAPFVRSWYRLSGALLSSHLEVVAAPAFFRRALRFSPDDAELFIMAGGVQELLASPRYRQMADASGWKTSGSAGDHLREAEALYRQALARTPSLAEARLRLGRVIGLQRRHEQALEALMIASDEELPDRLRYFLFVFIGDEEAALNRAQSARRAYEQAIALRPEASFAWLALSRTERVAGNRTDAVHAVEKMLAVARKQPDPWNEYYSAGLGPHAGELLDEFRRSFRRPR